MNSPGNVLKESSMQLLPHQVAFVEAFFDPASKRVILLRADVGLGKSVALVALMTRLLRQRPMARVVLLAPGALRQQFVEQLHREDIPALSVDRYQFREMIDSASGQELWPAGAVSVLSREFARQEDVVQALVATRWDLLIVDEAHQFRGSLTGEVVRRVGEASDRVVLATATLASSDLPGDFAKDDITVVEWRRDQVVDLNGALLDSIPRPIVRVVPFTLSTAELKLAEVVGELCRALEAGTTQQRWGARSLLRNHQSSPAALESGLRRIVENRNRVAHGVDPLPEFLGEEQLEDQVTPYLDIATAEIAAGIADRALGEIETAGNDSKLEAFIGLLRHIESLRTPSTRICVLTEYVNTLFYLAAEIEILGRTYHPYHGGMNAQSRQNYLARFNAGVGGGILTATRAALSDGVALTKVTDLVLYDIPGSPAALQQILARFDRFGRDTQLNIHVLEPSDGLGGSRAEFLDLLRQACGPTEFAQDK